VNSLVAASPDRKRFVLHMLFYANRGPRDASVRLAGKYRSARLWTSDREEARALEPQPGSDGVEVHLPPLEQYAAVELEV
jgi:hypothetical protein